jgi:hypothetical protein
MRTYFYNLRSPRLWWARIWVTSDGLISIASDYGHFGYWFGGPGCEIRRFLTGVDPSQDGYMAIKLADGRRVYDPDSTVRRIREEVVRMRKDKEIDRDTARELWNSVNEFELDHSDARASSWLDEDLVREHLGCDAYGYFAQQMPGDVRGFMRDIWPVFVETLKEELRVEQQQREAFGEVLEMGT